MKTKLLPLLLFTFATNAFAALDTPTEDFTDNNDGTVTHKKTGLTWQRCSVGQTWTGSSCSGSTLTFAYNQAITQTSNFAGYNDWRIPRVDELNSIVELATNYPAINNNVFLNPPLGFPANEFWSLSPSFYNSPIYVSFSIGYDGFGLSTNEKSVRFVRGGHLIDSLGEYTPTDDFTDNSDGTVFHKKTGLTWQRCSVGQIWNGSTCDGTPLKMSYDIAIQQISSLGDYAWRLPTQYELQTIVEYKNSNPSINQTIFPNTTSDIFWSSTMYSFNSSNAWNIGFDYGFHQDGAKNNNYAVRLVSVGKLSNTTPIATPTTIDLSSTLSQSSSRVKINENLTYTATVINNGTGTANNSLLKIYLPPRNVSVVSMPSDCMTTGKSLTCSLGNLAAGANTSRAITVNYIKSGGASLSALILTDSNDTNSANNVSRVVTAIKK